MLDAVVGLGSNLGDRRDYLLRAVQKVRELGELLALSALYETAPVGMPQPSFLNAALRLRTPLLPEELLDRLLAIERDLGRVRRERRGPRVIDLDILWFFQVRFVSDKLVVPHAELRSRAFALLPLLDVAPDATCPLDATPYREILASLDRLDACEVAGTRGGWA